MCLDSFKGLHRAIYCPIHAHGAKGDKIDIYQRMYENIADVWVKNGCLTHSLTIFAHDKITIDTWFHMGFGNMCIDAIRPLSDIAGDKNSTLEIRPATQNDAELLLPIITEHDKYYASSPIFMPVLKLTKLSDVGITNSKDSLTLIALDAGKPVGIMNITKDDTTFVDDDEKTLHLKGAYIKEEFRGTGLGAALLQYAIEWLRSKGYERCYVDYESTNRLGGRFWGKHFTPFAYSMFRKLDERITWADGNRFNDITI
jgi:GNAT superfamily N-acetyltransferase